MLDKVPVLDSAIRMPEEAEKGNRVLGERTTSCRNTFMAHIVWALSESGLSKRDRHKMHRRNDAFRHVAGHL